MTRIVHIPIDVNEIEMYDWLFIVHSNLQPEYNLYAYTDAIDMIDKIHEIMDNDESIFRVEIFKDLLWWGEVENV